MKAKRVDHVKKVYYQSLIGHTEDALKILCSYLTKKEEIVHSFCNRWGYDFSIFCKNIFYAVALHDIGKLTKEFQNNINAGKSSSKHPHALFGIPILLNIPFDIIENIPVALLAILGHHSQLHKGIYENFNLAGNVQYCENEIKKFIRIEINNLFKKLLFQKYFSLINLENFEFKPMNRSKISDTFILPLVRQDIINDIKTKAFFTYFYSILQLCDDYSSANFTSYIIENTPTHFEFDSILSDTSHLVYDIKISEDELKKKLFSNLIPYKFQNSLAENSSPFSFLFAACGRGKTEASLWWAFRIKELYKKDRIIFALPTQVTCNAMYSRLIDEYGFDENNIGLFHGKGLIALKYRGFEFNDDLESDSDTDYKSYDILRDEVFKGNVFFKPITVTTIDHLAYAFVHGYSQADFACGNLQNAIIIFDEVHYYEQYTLNILLGLFDILRKMLIPHLLMTGTAPEFLIDHFRSNNYSFIVDNEGLSFQPFIIQKKDNIQIFENDEVFESIADDYKLGKNIFIILNQVEWSQSFYSGLKEYFWNNYSITPEIILYHSRFIHRDRVRKEIEIKSSVENKPCILVTTQVIEISLNISCDVMYTTIAPPDAVGQRGGRLNRTGKYYKNGSEYVLKLFNQQEYHPYNENIIMDSWKYFEEGPYTYYKIKKVCDKVYKDVILRKNRNYIDYFHKNILFGDHHSTITFGDDEGKSLKIREDNYQQIDVVPSRVFDEAQILITKNKAFWVEYKVRIPLYKFKMDIKENGESIHFRKHQKFNIIECDYEYNYEYGVSFNKTFSRVAIF